MGMKKKVILLRKKARTGILALLVLALILSTTGVYAQTEDEQGLFTASKPLDWGNDKSFESFEAPMPGPFVVENGAVKMRASAQQDTGDYCYTVSVSFTGSYSSGKVSGETEGSYHALRWGGGWGKYKGEGEWNGQIDPKTGIGKGTYTVKLNRHVHPAPGFTGPDVTEPYSGTISGTWETTFDVKAAPLKLTVSGVKVTYPDGTTVTVEKGKTKVVDFEADMIIKPLDLKSKPIIILPPDRILGSVL